MYGAEKRQYTTHNKSLSSYTLSHRAGTVPLDSATCFGCLQLFHYLLALTSCRICFE